MSTQLKCNLVEDILATITGQEPIRRGTTWYFHGPHAPSQQYHLRLKPGNKDELIGDYCIDNNHCELWVKEDELIISNQGQQQFRFDLLNELNKVRAHFLSFGSIINTTFSH